MVQAANISRSVDISFRNAKTKKFYLPPKPNGNGIGRGAMDNETSRSLDLSESGGLFLGGFSSSTISSIGGWKEAK